MYGFNSVTFVCFNFSLFLRVFRCDLIEDNYLEVFRFNNCQINKTSFENILLLFKHSSVDFFCLIMYQSISCFFDNQTAKVVSLLRASRFYFCCLVSIFKNFVNFSHFFMIPYKIEEGHKDFWPWKGHKYFWPWECHKYF